MTITDDKFTSFELTLLLLIHRVGDHRHDDVVKGLAHARARAVARARDGGAALRVGEGCAGANWHPHRVV